VTPAANIRQLCTRLLEAENDEAAKRILSGTEKREYCARLSEKWREKWSGNIASIKMTWPQTVRFNDQGWRDVEHPGGTEASEAISMYPGRRNPRLPIMLNHG